MTSCDLLSDELGCLIFVDISGYMFASIVIVLFCVFYVYPLILDRFDIVCTTRQLRALLY